jgi:hypothetical protein
MAEIRHVEDLVGEELSAVCFVTDYVEFHFAGPVLRSLSSPTVSQGNLHWTFPEEGSRDALCRLIGTTVSALSLVETEKLEIVMTNGMVMRVPLDLSSRVGPEAMHFVPAGGGIEVW